MQFEEDIDKDPDDSNFMPIEEDDEFLEDDLGLDDDLLADDGSLDDDKEEEEEELDVI